MNNYMTVSVLLFTYNQVDFVEQAVMSVLGQTRMPDEIIVSDDCSTDETYVKIHDVIRKHNTKANIVIRRNNENLGIIKHVNRVLELASGNLIIMAAGDDIMASNRVQKTFEVWSNSEFKKMCIFSNAYVIDRSGNILNLFYSDPKVTKNINEFLYTGVSWIGGFSAAFHRGLFNDFGPLYEGTFQEDGLIAFRALLCDGVYYLDEPLVYYRRHSNNAFDKTDLQKLKKLYRSEIGLVQGRLVDFSRHMTPSLWMNIRIYSVLVKWLIGKFMMSNVPFIIDARFYLARVYRNFRDV